MEATGKLINTREIWSKEKLIDFATTDDYYRWNALSQYNFHLIMESIFGDKVEMSVKDFVRLYDDKVDSHTYATRVPKGFKAKRKR